MKTYKEIQITVIDIFFINIYNQIVVEVVYCMQMLGLASNAE